MSGWLKFAIVCAAALTNGALLALTTAAPDWAIVQTGMLTAGIVSIAANQP